jgi:hypothetical protein
VAAASTMNDGTCVDVVDGMCGPSPVSKRFTHVLRDAMDAPRTGKPRRSAALRCRRCGYVLLVRWPRLVAARCPAARLLPPSHTTMLIRAARSFPAMPANDRPISQPKRCWLCCCPRSTNQPPPSPKRLHGLESSHRHNEVDIGPRVVVVVQNKLHRARPWPRVQAPRRGRIGRLACAGASRSAPAQRVLPWCRRLDGWIVCRTLLARPVALLLPPWADPSTVRGGDNRQIRSCAS